MSDIAPLTYRVPQAAAKLGVSTAMVYEKVRAFEWPCTRMGRHIHFTPADLAAILALCQQPAVAAKKPRRRSA